MASSSQDRPQGLNDQLEQELERILTAPTSQERRQFRLLSAQLLACFLLCLLAISVAFLLPSGESNVQQALLLPANAQQLAAAPEEPFDCLQLWAAARNAREGGTPLGATTSSSLSGTTTEDPSFFDALVQGYHRGLEQRHCMQSLRMQWMLPDSGAPSQ